MELLKRMILGMSVLVLASCGGGSTSTTSTETTNTETTYTVTTLVGTTAQTGTTDGTGSAARFTSLFGVAVDAAGVVYVVDYGAHTIRKITSGGVVSTLAGSPGQPGTADGTGSAAGFVSPSGVAVDSSGNLYVSDTGSYRIRKITATGTVTTLAGSINGGTSVDGTGAAASFHSPRGIAIDSAGNLYVTESDNHVIRKITPDGVVTTLAGTAGQSGSADGTGPAARFNFPQSIVVAASGNIYVTDTDNHTIRKITPAGVVTTVAGAAGQFGSTDGAGAAAQFDSPYSIAAGSDGNLFVSDAGNRTVRKITSAGVVTTIAGTAGQLGSVDGVGAAARFENALGIAVDSGGVVYLTEHNNVTVRKITPSQ